MKSAGLWTLIDGGDKAASAVAAAANTDRGRGERGRGGGFGRLLLTSADGVKLLIKEKAATCRYQPLPGPSSDPLHPPHAYVSTAFVIGTRATRDDTHGDPRLLRCHGTYSRALLAQIQEKKGTSRGKNDRKRTTFLAEGSANRSICSVIQTFSSVLTRHLSRYKKI